MADTATLSDARRRLLEKYLREDTAATMSSDAAIQPKPLHAPMPVSSLQEQLLLRERRNPGCPPLYNESICIKMQGPLDVSALEQSLTEIIERHEAWRTSYDFKDDSCTMQMIHPAPERLELSVLDLRGSTHSEADAEIQRLAGEMVRQPFDLREGTLLRARMFRTADLEHFLFLSAHLSIVDGVSVYQIFPFELASLYRARLSRRPSSLPTLPLQLKDYAYWQRQWLKSKEKAKQVAYWQKQLAGKLPVFDWPMDRPRPAIQSFRGAIQSFVLPDEIVVALEALSRREGVSLFVGLLAGFVSLLHLSTRQEDIIVGTPSPAGRKRSEVQRLLGYFLNPVALRFDMTGNPAFRMLLRQAQGLTWEALSNDEVPLEVLAQELGKKMDPSRNPLFTVAISLQPPMPQLDLDWTVSSMDIESGGAPWDLYLAFIKRPGETIVRAQYNPDLFESRTITRMMSDYQALLRAVVANPAVSISQIDVGPRTVAGDGLVQ